MKVIDTLEAVLLFHSSSPWDEEKKLRWLNLTGNNEATTKVLCDAVRATLKELQEEINDNS